jgi:hypothetical protein
MRKLQIIPPLMLMLCVPSARAQKGDWKAVENLAPGTRISVKLAVRAICFFEYASDDELVCRTHVAAPIGAISYKRQYPRPKIREVRLEYSEAADTAIGAAVGGGAGAIVGAVAGGNGTITRGGGAVILGGIGALIGGAFGRDFPIAHRKVVYKR